MRIRYPATSVSINKRGTTHELQQNIFSIINTYMYELLIVVLAAVHSEDVVVD